MLSSSLITLGRFAFTIDGKALPNPSTRKARALLAYLILHKNQSIARERLIETFWPDSAVTGGRESFRSALWSVRRSLLVATSSPEDYLFADKFVVRWVAETSLDAIDFVELASNNDPNAQEIAISLYQGDFLEGNYDDWVVAERERLASAYEALLARVVRSSRNADAAQRLLARNPYDEEAYTTLIQAELALDRRLGALAFVKRCRASLAEVAAKPSDEFEEKFGALSRIEPDTTSEFALPFTGRDVEVAALTTALTEAEANRGRVTLVHGEAGIGKSTLLDRVAQLATQRGFRVIAVRCNEGDAQVFGPWPRVYQQLIGGDLSTTLERAQLINLGTVTARAIAESMDRAIALIVDDAHALSGDAHDIFVGIAAAAPASCALIVSVRPEGLRTVRSRLDQGRINELHVGRFGRIDVERALIQVMGTVDPRFIDTLFARTAGHPLFVSSLLQMLAQSGTLRREGQRWRIAESVDNRVELPDSLRHFIEARLQARGNDPHAIACALALEPSANAKDLMSVLNFDEARCLDAIDDLLALGIITEPASGSQFAFSHDMFREVAANGLNAGRRAALHHFFARRFKESDEPDASLRCARHLRASGQPLAAAEAFLQAATEARRCNATRDALERCDEGIRAVERLDHSDRRAVVMSRLQRVIAETALSSGDVGTALQAATQSVATIRTTTQALDLAESLTTRASVHGMLSKFDEQFADASEACRLGSNERSGQGQARALIQVANAARRLARRDEALAAAREAYEVAARCGYWPSAHIAAEELVLTQSTWWQFKEAIESSELAADIATRAVPVSAVIHHVTRSSLFYLLERYADLEAELQKARLILHELVEPNQLEPSVFPMRLLPYAERYMFAVVSATRARWIGALTAANEATGSSDQAACAVIQDAVKLVQIDALLGLDTTADNEKAVQLTAELTDSNMPQSVFGWSDCRALAKARVAARVRDPNAPRLLRVALDWAEENARRTPLNADRAFDTIAVAAKGIGADEISRCGWSRRNFYRAQRRASAGSAWGGSG